MNPLSLMFRGVDLIVVEDGHQFYDYMSDVTHVVTKGNAVTQGRSIFLVQHDYDMIKARYPNQDPTSANSA